MLYRIIILCAGIGERLRPYTYNTNKSLLQIKGKTIIEHFLDTLLPFSDKIGKVHICVGWKQLQFRKLLGKNYHGLPIKYIYNPLYEVTGAGQTLYLASRILQYHPCIMLEGDHYVHPEIMKLLFNSPYKNAVLVDQNLSKISYDEEVLAYTHESSGENGTISYLKWLPQYPPEPKGEALTIFKMDKKSSRDLAVHLKNHLLQDGQAIKEIITPLNTLFHHHIFHMIPTQGYDWIEIDFKKDLKKARLMNFDVF